MRSRAAGAFVCIPVRAADVDVAERISAEVHAAGACGLEERSSSGDGTVGLQVYARACDAEAVRRAALSAGGDRAQVGACEILQEVDWTTEWRRGLRALDVSPRFSIRPGFVAPSAVAADGTELVIDPGQAFGTGEHESTRLALELLDADVCERGCVKRVFDLGTGTGVLALAALRLGARCAVACDLDPVATRTACYNAKRNALLERFSVFTGSLSALSHSASFELILANLLRSELQPLIPELSERLRPGGRAIFSGLLASDVPRIAEDLATAGLARCGERSRRDGNGEVWVGLLTQRVGI